MRDYTLAKKSFEDTIDTNHYFDSINAEIVKNKLEDAIQKRYAPLIFLMGEPGVGKSYMLHLVIQELKDKSSNILINYPFKTNIELIKILFEVQNLEYDESVSFNQIQKQLLNLYKDKKYTIFIDEAQLLDDEQIEFIRVLSDTKIFQFVLSMHQKEGKIILEKDHFKSRTKVVIDYKSLHFSEVNRYIQSTLLITNNSEISFMFTQKHAKKITKYCYGNFRTIKKFVYVLLSLLEYAKDNRLRKYDNINSCLLKMSALEIGVLND